MIRTHPVCKYGASKDDAKVCSVASNRDPARNPNSVLVRYFLMCGCAITSSHYSNITELAYMGRCVLNYLPDTTCAPSSLSV
uniref:Uncharacterized protein n=1 Tax=Lactuca sativa TaxID=4236 RepID=A0A9R1WPJ8_LACSA|nr:hypothetical protein LSAT_V11C900466040 [Lactuca sativa]